MENLPPFIPVLFVCVVLLTLFLFLRAADFAKPFTFICVAWILLQGFIGFTGFYETTTGTPPRFILLLGPPLVSIALLFSTKRGRRFLDTFNVRWLTLLHTIRIPIEMILLGLFTYKTVPEIMTFEGQNFDIFSGITAPVMWYMLSRMGNTSAKWQLAWNVICLVLLVNIVTIAIFSAPFSFQRFGFEQPAIAVLYFPFVWLPAFVVPAVLLAHLAAIRQWILKIREQRLSTSSSRHSNKAEAHIF